MILSKLLRETNMVVHGFFNKKNGFSKGIYKSLNCGLGSKDNKKNIIKNLNYVRKKLNSNGYFVSIGSNVVVSSVQIFTITL